jgi:hypothetical protein
MKIKIFLTVFVFVILSALVFGYIYLYQQIDRRVPPTHENENENNVYTQEEKTNLIKEVEPFLFTSTNLKLFYEGGPVHWGSRTINFVNVQSTSDSKIVNLHVVHESDMKGELPKKQWNQKWEAKFDGSLYIDDVLMLKSPIAVGQKWAITDYKPVIDKDKKYTANIKITSVVNNLNESNIEVKKVTTTLTIDDIKTVDGGVYTETRVFESGIGLREFKATEPTISNLILTYWLQNNSVI